MPRARLNTPNYKLVERNRIWLVQWWSDGRDHRLSTRTTDRRAAEVYLTQLIAGTQEALVPARATVKQILDAYLDLFVQDVFAAELPHLKFLVVDSLIAHEMQTAKKNDTEGMMPKPTSKHERKFWFEKEVRVVPLYSVPI